MQCANKDHMTHELKDIYLWSCVIKVCWGLEEIAQWLRALAKYTIVMIRVWISTLRHKTGYPEKCL